MSVSSVSSKSSAFPVKQNTEPNPLNIDQDLHKKISSIINSQSQNPFASRSRSGSLINRGLEKEPPRRSRSGSISKFYGSISKKFLKQDKEEEKKDLGLIFQSPKQSEKEEIQISKPSESVEFREGLNLFLKGEWTLDFNVLCKTIKPHLIIVIEFRENEESEWRNTAFAKVSNFPRRRKIDPDGSEHIAVNYEMTQNSTDYFGKISKEIMDSNLLRIRVVKKSEIKCTQKFVTEGGFKDSRRVFLEDL